MLKLMLFCTVIFPLIITIAAILAGFLLGGKIMIVHFVPIFLGWVITGLIIGLIINKVQKRRANQF